MRRRNFSEWQRVPSADEREQLADGLAATLGRAVASAGRE
jgi:hypothetical protein